MSGKSLDGHGRWRSVTVSFRMSPEEAALLDDLVFMSGLAKQDYITARLLGRDVVVKPNSRFQKAMRHSVGEVLYELRRLESASDASPELCKVLKALARVYEGLGNGSGESAGDGGKTERINGLERR